MESKIAAAIKAAYAPVAILWTDTLPERAVSFKPGKWGCAMWWLAAAAKGKTAAFSAETYGCWGAGVGLGFGNEYLKFPGGVECFQRFLSTGNESSPQGQAVAKEIKPCVTGALMEDFLHGEGYMQSPELVSDFIENLPIMEAPAKYVVFKPLPEVGPDKEQPQVVIFLANPDQLAALVVLANYGHPGVDHVRIPFAAGCQCIGIFAYEEAQSEAPRAVVGMMDISARLALRKQLEKDLVTVAVPWKKFVEMEGHAAGSFLERPTWQALMEQ